jgi:flavin-dependent dehydrogenase
VYGTGLHLDRDKFDTSLRRAAAEAGAEVVTNARLECRNGATLRCNGREERLNYRWLVDASGRTAAACRARGARRNVEDNLVAFHARFDAPPGVIDADCRTVIESCPSGWWYTARVPSAQRVVAFFTDRDLISTRTALSATDMMGSLRQTRHVRAIIEANGYALPASVRGIDASSSRLDVFAGDKWLAVGDAAVAFDPLSSQGVFNALYTGLRAGEALRDYFSGDVSIDRPLFSPARRDPPSLSAQSLIILWSRDSMAEREVLGSSPPTRGHARSHCDESMISRRNVEVELTR